MGDDLRSRAALGRGYLVQDLLANIQHYPSLLADVTLNAKALTAQATLMNMLNSLPEDSFVLHYIYDNIRQPVEVMGR